MYILDKVNNKLSLIKHVENIVIKNDNKLLM